MEKTPNTNNVTPHTRCGYAGHSSDETCDNLVRKDETSTAGNLLTLRRNFSDGLFRHKFAHTACVALAYLASAWRMSLVGPTLPDIRRIIKEDLSTASWIISALALGGLVGCIGGGILYDRYNRCMVLGSLTFLLAAGSLAIIWLNTFSTMVAAHAFVGMCAYGIDTVAVADIGLVWRHASAPVLQAASFAYGLGATIAPLTTEPFVSKREAVLPSFNQLLNHSYDDVHIAFPTSNDRNDTSYNRPESALNYTTEKLTYKPTKIYYAFVIAATVGFVAFLSMVLQVFILGNVHNKKQDVNTESEKCVDKKLEYPLDRAWKVVFVLLLSVVLASYCTVERLVGSYLMTYVIERLQWDKRSGANVTTAFWASFTVGRLVCIIVVKVANHRVVFTCLLSFLLFGEILMLVAAYSSLNTLVWISCLMYGLGMSGLGASTLSWVSTKVCPMTGKISSVMVTVVIIFAIVYPLFIGNLMDSVSYDWFVYLAIVLTGIIFGLLIVAEVVYSILTYNMKVKCSPLFCNNKLDCKRL